MLTQQTIDTVKSTVPLLESAGTAITDHFYQRMFNHNPELKNIFNMSNQKSGAQQFALFGAIAAYAKNIDNLEALTPMVERVAHKHTSYFIQPDDYAIVGHHLIETLRELAPQAFTPEVETAWTEAYGFLADVLSGRERVLYQSTEEKTGGWYSTRQFMVKDKRVESELVTSFLLEPADKGSVVDFSPGQYLGIRVTPANAQYSEIRQYSLSDKPNGRSYRISVKRELSPQTGTISNYLHDHIYIGDSVEAFPPAGVFYLQEGHNPVVLVSAGVGFTPMLSMLETIQATNPTRPVFFLHACENEAQHSFRERLTDIENNNPAVKSFYWYNQPTGETQGFRGLMDVSQVADELVLNKSDFYLCGPAGFMKFIKAQLREAGVTEDQIFYEIFGPHADF